MRSQEQITTIIVQIIWFLAELFCSLSRNSLETEISCRRRADDVQTMCRRRADDVQTTREWEFVGDLTYVVRNVIRNVVCTCARHLQAISCRRRANDVQTICRWHKSEISGEISPADDICRLDVICTSSAHLPELPNFMQYYTWCHLNVICTSSACHPHIVWRHKCHPHVIRRHVRNPHVICRHICHPHIICRIPHGQSGPELSFYCNRNWLLNGICHNNVELFISGSCK